MHRDLIISLIAFLVVATILLTGHTDRQPFIAASPPVEVEETVATDEVTEEGVTQPEETDRWSPGLGIGANGKPGIEVAPGIVMDYDGGIGVGFGF